ncbi:response regulator transcription factor [Spirosoma panaciterrae]|uniref:response regulator transcription factor n=1 Tax=Spirosoma panaciterrae TaxID=496058 RepID=UPI00035E5AA2|nr:response regulator [Spirosoma panaciterrae]
MANVLIADDEPNILLSLEFLMKKEGHKVFIARDGGEAYELLQHHKPDLLMLDIMMPRMNGLELCRYVKSTDGFQHSKIIILSAKGKEADIQRGYESGADLYVAKPFSTRDLVVKVNQLLSA